MGDNVHCTYTYVNLAALVCRGPEQWNVEEIEVDPPLASEVRVRMLYASICHSDVLCSRGFPFVN